MTHGGQEFTLGHIGGFRRFLCRPQLGGLLGDLRLQGLGIIKLLLLNLSVILFVFFHDILEFFFQNTCPTVKLFFLNS